MKIKKLRKEFLGCAEKNYSLNTRAYCMHDVGKHDQHSQCGSTPGPNHALDCPKYVHECMLIIGHGMHVQRCSCAHLSANFESSSDFVQGVTD